jgi:5-(carboxyamino)imidazole ribonucleotide mutase
LAIRMLANHDSELLEKVLAYQDELRSMVVNKQEKLDAIGYEAYLKQMP